MEPCCRSLNNWPGQINNVKTYCAFERSTRHKRQFPPMYITTKISWLAADDEYTWRCTDEQMGDGSLLY